MSLRSIFCYPSSSIIIVLTLLLLDPSSAWDAPADAALLWAAEHGYTIGSVKAEKLPDRPRGFIATNNIKVSTHENLIACAC
jgi:hypothetical protein